MNTNIKSNIKAIILGLALALGVGYVGATGTFTSPTCAPPGCNTDAPVNVGSTSQGKLSGLVLSKTQGGITSGLVLIASNLAMFATDGNISAGGATFNGPILINDGTQGNNKVLVSNGVGLASWATSSSVVTAQPNILGNGYIYTENNEGAAEVIAVLDPGTYTFSGNLSTRNNGGVDQWVGFATASTGGNIYSDFSSKLVADFPSAAAGSTYNLTNKSYTLYVVRGAVPNTWTKWTLPASQTLTIGSRTYVYLLANQTYASGNLYFTKQ